MSYQIASAQAQRSTGEIRIDRSTAEACSDAFEEVKLSRKAIADLEARAVAAEKALALAERLAESEGKRADAERARAEAEKKSAASLQIALDASKAIETAKDEQIRVRTDERDFWQGKYKSERKGRTIERILSIGSHILRTVF